MKARDASPADLPRRKLLTCMRDSAIALWAVGGGVPVLMKADAAEAASGFTFAQISDTHIGFAKEPNATPDATLVQALAALKTPAPAFLLHTGDVSHLAKPAEFDAAAAIMATAGVETFYVPGEHDVLEDDGAGFFGRFGMRGAVNGWYSFDHGGVHFVGLVNVLNLKAGGLGTLGGDQLSWLRGDLKGRTSSTPIVVFAHMPLWPLYPEWGWGTDDAAAVLDLLKRFGSVTVLNGHVHQVMQKVEGHVTFMTARSTAFPQPAPGAGAGPGPLKVPAERLKGLLGVRRIDVRHGAPAIADATLEA
jgi:hypothetical protein